MKVINFEYHPNDSRVRLEANGICQSLTSRMGTGGGNVPIIMLIRNDASIGVDSYNQTASFEIAPPLRAGEGGDEKAKVLILNDQGGQQISCEKKDISPCLRAQDHGHPPIVIYGKDNINGKKVL